MTQYSRDAYIILFSLGRKKRIYLAKKTKGQDVESHFAFFYLGDRNASKQKTSLG